MNISGTVKLYRWEDCGEQGDLGDLGEWGDLGDMGTIRYTDQINREKKRNIDENMGKAYKRIKLNININMTTKSEVCFPANTRSGNLRKEKIHAMGLIWHCAACKGRCINRLWFFSFLNQLRERQRWSGLGEERKLEEGSEKRRDRKQLQRSVLFYKHIDATIKRRKQHFKSNFLKMSTENYFCNAMIQWPAMLLNNGGTLSLYTLKEKRPTIIRGKLNTDLNNYKKQRKFYLQKKNLI